MRRLKEALECLHYYYKTEKPALHYPFILRATGASSAWLSPSAGEKVCYIGFLVYLSEDTFNGNQERLQHLSKIETLLSKFEAIPHYGKFFTIENYDFGKLLPRWNDFKTLRDRVDPTGRFLNPWLKKFLSISDTREIQCRL
jgi:FAD/FMN-containing dehydrogenase